MVVLPLTVLRDLEFPQSGSVRLNQNHITKQNVQA